MLGRYSVVNLEEEIKVATYNIEQENWKQTYVTQNAVV